MNLLHVIASFVLLSSFTLIAQTEVSPASVPGNDSLKKSLSSDIAKTMWITGKVVLDGGSAPPNRVTVILRCGMAELARVTSDSKGSFTMMLNSDEEVSGRARPLTGRMGPNLPDCDVLTDSPEYASQSTRLFGGMHQDINDVGTIVLHPRTAADGFTVSATTLAAPDKAKTAFEKGQQQEKKGRWAAACVFPRRRGVSADRLLLSAAVRPDEQREAARLAGARVVSAHGRCGNAAARARTDGGGGVTAACDRGRIVGATRLRNPERRTRGGRARADR